MGQAYRAPDTGATDKGGTEQLPSRRIRWDSELRVVIDPSSMSKVCAQFSGGLSKGKSGRKIRTRKSGQTEMILTEADVFGITPTRLH
jgi:hypothetical protein